MLLNVSGMLANVSNWLCREAEEVGWDGNKAPICNACQSLQCKCSTMPISSYQPDVTKDEPGKRYV